ncbi:D-glucuronate isomerase [Pilibacter termitis]|uniref:Uronate isomerase n=1 Tax=Pilibacter termitis TaxID=263852 RepID=A0A1T4KR43_9ENTE|nr:glucuronate isomerase [Pilibacter termitis]SJZ44807.1 D-glucuronate isomerase [Pilibacter termitis]
MFLNEDFLLDNESGKKLFHEVAKNIPIIDYHCHLSPKEMVENKPYRNLTHIWLGGDHYKWRLMRANGVNERYITGEAEDFEKFRYFVRSLQKAAGNPIYEWTHLELKRFFGIHEVLSEENIKEIWEKCNEMLAKDEFRPRSLVVKSRVKVVCTTDDPIDNLADHVRLKELEKNFQVLPTFRPDKAFQLQKETFSDYIDKLSAITEKEIQSFDDVVNALEKRLLFFKKNGCKLSDHGFGAIPQLKRSWSSVELDVVLNKALLKKELLAEEVEAYHFSLFQRLMALYSKHNIVMQWHFNSPRDFNQEMYQKLGADTGYDAIGDASEITQSMGKMLDIAAQNGGLPTSIWYSLNPNDWLSILTVMGCFQNGNGYQKQHLGSGWWFNDTYSGMRRQMTELAEQSLFGNFVGMLTDSRSFLSYPRHEYFRRVLCGLVGEWVESGRLPYSVAEQSVRAISFQNANKLFFRGSIADD